MLKILFILNVEIQGLNIPNAEKFLSLLKQLIYYRLDVIAVTVTRIKIHVSLTNNLFLNNYYFDFILTESSTGGTLLLIIYYTSLVINIYKTTELESTFIEVINAQKVISLLGVLINIKPE